MRGLIRKVWTVLLGAALLTCAFGSHTVFAEDLPGGDTPQQINSDAQPADGDTQPADADLLPTDNLQITVDPQPTDNFQKTVDSQPTEDLQKTVDLQPTDNLQKTVDAQPTDNLQKTVDSQPTDNLQLTVNPQPTGDSQPTADPQPTGDLPPAGDKLRSEDPQQDQERKDPPAAPDEIIAAEVYVRLGGELPANIQQDDSAANYTTKLFTVRVNLSALERRLKADGLSTNYKPPYNSNWRYYSHVTTGAPDPAAFWNNYVLPSIEDASERALFVSKFPEGGFIGYVLKREAYAGFHIDGIVKAKTAPQDPPVSPHSTPVTAENYPRLEISTNVRNAARSNKTPDHADLDARDEVFTYELKTVIPNADTAAWIDRFYISDTLTEELTLAGEVIVSVDGQRVAFPAQHVEQDGQILTVDLPKEFLAANTGKEICVSFGVRIKDGVSLAKYANAANGGRIEVPNSCSYHVLLHREEEPGGARRLPSEREPDVSEFSGVATVTPPSAEIRLEEMINGRKTDGSPVVLSSRYEEVTYTIKAYVVQRADLRTLSISNTIADVMEFRGEVEVLVGGIRTEGLSQIFDKTVVVSVPEKYLTDAALKQPVTVTFRAAIIHGVDLTSYIDGGVDGVCISNNASCQIAQGAAPVPSNAVRFILSDPGIEVSVNNAKSTVLQNRNEVFTYEVRTRVPERARMQRFAVSDRIADVLEFVGNVSVTVGGYELKNVASVSGQELRVTLTGEQLMANRGKAVIITFTVRLRSDAAVAALAAGIPNDAVYSIDNKPEANSATVTVTAAETQPGESTEASAAETEEKETASAEEEETKAGDDSTEAAPVEGGKAKDAETAPAGNEDDMPIARVLGMRRGGQGTEAENSRNGQTGDPKDLRPQESFFAMALMGLAVLLSFHNPKERESSRH